MVADELLQLFDAQMRRPNQPDGCMYIGDGWSAVIRPPADGNVEPLVARLREVGGWVEWKYFSHDGADLPAKLVAAGLVPEDEETLVVAAADSIARPAAEVELREDAEAFTQVVNEIFGDKGHPLPDGAVPVVACVDGRPVSCGRVDLEPGVEFAGLYGGATLPEFRGRGLYRATVARRAEIAREAGYRWIYVDALPTSRPILERLGFVAITTTTPYVLPPSAG